MTYQKTMERKMPLWGPRWKQPAASEQKDYHDIASIMSRWKGYQSAEGRFNLFVTSFFNSSFSKDYDKLLRRMDLLPNHISMHIIEQLATASGGCIDRYILTFRDYLISEPDLKLKSELDTIIKKYDLIHP
jgi:hypothetical protein